MGHIHYFVDRVVTVKSVFQSEILVFINQCTRRQISDNRHFHTLKYLSFENYWSIYINFWVHCL